MNPDVIKLNNQFVNNFKQVTLQNSQIMDTGTDILNASGQSVLNKVPTEESPKKKVCYISYETFYHADKPILPLLASAFQVNYYLIEPTDSIIDGAEIEKFSKESGINTIRFKHESRRRSIKQLFYYIKLLTKVLALKPDVVFFVAEYNIYFALLAPFLLSRKKTVIAFHDVLPHKKETNFLKDWSLEILKRAYKNFHFFSETQMNIFKSSHQKKTCSFTPLFLSEYGPAPVNKAAASDKVNFLFFGSIKYYKGLDLLFQASEELIKEGISDFQVTVAGQGDYWNQAKSLIHNTGNYSFHTRFIEDSEIPNFFSEASYLVLPYRDVTQSGPLAVSHYYKVPAIAADHLGFKEHIQHQLNGYLFKSEDVGALKEVMRACILQSDEQYKQVKENLCNYVDKKYSKEKILEQYKVIFENLAQAS